MSETRESVEKITAPMLASMKSAITRIDEALAEIEDARKSPFAEVADKVAREAMDEAYRRGTEALRWAQAARWRLEGRR